MDFLHEKPIESPLPDVDDDVGRGSHESSDAFEEPELPLVSETGATAAMVTH